MTKRISKPASGTKKTSSRRGTSGKTAATARTEPERPPTGSMAEFIESIANQIREMTPAEYRESLIRTGIITPDGKLTKEYRQ